MFRTLFKLGFGLVVIVILAVAGWVGLQYYVYKKSPEYQAKEFVKDWERKYAEDTYGGDTPEETLRLFISALKQGDTELAAKYFVVDKQQEWREDLAKLKEKNLLGEMVRDLEREKFKNNISDNQINFDVANEQKEAILSILLGKNINGKWKILEL